MNLSAETHWICPNCPAVDVTHEVEPHTRFHDCAGLAGLTAPMVREGVKCKVEAVEREDYVGNEDVRYDDNGRPIMSVLTTRDDGNDLVVFAPTANAHVESRI
jgi:hypothetical protein